MAHISIRDIRKRYDGKQVLHGLDVEIEDGAFVVIVGPSGCGKSTLLRMIAGLEDITEGSIAIDGREIGHLDPADRGCAMVFQNYALYPHMTVRDNIGYPLKIAGLGKAERAARVLEAARILDLVDYLDRRPAQLSGGQRQRVAMGRAIVREPSVFLFDEPLSNLDAKLRVTMRIEIKRLHRRLKATSIFVTHDQVEAMTLADRLIVMNGGVIEQVGTPAEIYREPASAFVAGFLGAPSMNLLAARVVEGGHLAVESAPGRTFPFPGLRREPGSRVSLGIRPEHIVLTDGQGGAGGLGASIDLVEELGSGRVAYCSVGEDEVAVMLPAGAPQAGTGNVMLGFPAEALHVFDAESGRRLAGQGLRAR